jgi:hypothetical protein
MINVEQTVIGQYANSPIMLQLINNMNSYVDPTVNLQSFYTQIRNVLTATGYGLDVWGRIVGVPRVLNIPDVALGGALYFNESSVGIPFGPGGSAPFSSGANAMTNYRLSDAAYQTLILVKALANISICSAPAINQMIRNLFGTSSAFISDIGNMKMQIDIQNISVLDFYILVYSKALPRPSGVLTYLYNGYVAGKTFMFKESGAGTPFSYGVFFSGQYTALSY